MNRKIKELTKILEDTTEINRDQEARIRDDLQGAWNGVFEDMTCWQRFQEALDESRDLSTDGHGEIIRYVQVDLPDFDTEVQQFCEEYLESTYCFKVNWDNSYVYEWEWMIIGNWSESEELFYTEHTGMGKTIIKEEEWTDDDDEKDYEKRNQLIEEWMEENGVFPSVLRFDYYGNPSYDEDYYEWLKKKGEGNGV